MALNQLSKYLANKFSLISFTVLLLISASISADIKIIQQSLGRDFGVVVGDRIEHSYIIAVPAEFSLSVASLPSKGDVNYWLRLLSVHYDEIGKDKGLKKYKVQIVFQTFYAPLDVRVLTTPTIELHFHAGDQQQTINLPAWQFSMSPLKETAPISSKSGGSPRAFMKPDIPVLAIDMDGQRLKIILLGTSAVILLFMWLALTGKIMSFTRSPFQLAGIKIKKLKNKQDDSMVTHAIYDVHQAFNSVAHHAVFSHQIDGFVTAFPEFSSQKQNITAFYDMSMNILYGETKAKPYHFDQLISLCRTMVKAERLALKK